MRRAKPQGPNSKQIPSFNNQNRLVRALMLGDWSFPGAWVLGFGVLLYADFHLG
jgi:hypothetical protein